MNDIDADAPTAAMDGHDSVIGLQRNPHLSGARPERDEHERMVCRDSSASVESASATSQLNVSAAFRRRMDFFSSNTWQEQIMNAEDLARSR